MEALDNLTEEQLEVLGNVLVALFKKRSVPDHDKEFGYKRYDLEGGTKTAVWQGLSLIK